MRSLLDQCNRPGYPPDYLVARIRGRMDRREDDVHGEPTGGSRYLADDTVIWDAAAKARRWIYLQMDGNLREILVPVFVHFELRTLVLCLRTLESRQAEFRMVDLEHSLLAKGLKNIFLSPATPAEVIGRVEKFMGDSAFAMNGLVASYGEGGVQGCEEFLRRRFLEQGVAVRRHPAVTGWFRKLIDLRNILTMAKCLRWQVDPTPGLIKGGHLGLRAANQFPAEANLEKLVQRFTGGGKLTTAELHPVKLGPLLHDHLSQQMARRMRSPEPVECCLGYLWHGYAGSRKRSGTYHAARFAEYFPANPESAQ